MAVKPLMTFIGAAAVAAVLGVGAAGCGNDDNSGSGGTLYAISARGEAVAIPVDDGEVYIIHTNDTHGWVTHDAAASVIGFDYTAGIKNAAGKNALLVDAGDFSNGVPFAALTKGEAVQEVMGMAGFDVGTVGNHEFDYIGNIGAIIDRSPYPLISANVTYQGSPILPPTHTVTLPNGAKVGFVGITTPETLYKSNAGAVVGYGFGNLAGIIEHTQTNAAALRAGGCDIVIALVHLGVDASTVETSWALADGVGTAVDAIIDGHSHTPPSGNIIRNGVWVVSTGGESNSNVGLLRFKRANGAFAVEPYYINFATAVRHYKPVAGVTRLINKHNAPIDEMKRKVVARTAVFLDGERENVRRRETNLGNIAADAVRAFTGADFSYVNGGAVRASISAGDITHNDMLTAFPFGTAMLKAEVKGSVILQALETGVGDYPGLSGGFPQVSGIAFAFDPSLPKGGRVVWAKIGGRGIEPDAVYIMGTIDFPAAGNDGMSMLIEPFKTPISYDHPVGFKGETTMMDVITWYMNNFDLSGAEVVGGGGGGRVIVIGEEELDEAA